jgi:hypothetical protein
MATNFRLSENGIRKTRAFYSTNARRKKLAFLLSAHHCENRQQSETVQQPDIALATMG